MRRFLRCAAWVYMALSLPMWIVALYGWQYIYLFDVMPQFSAAQEEYSAGHDSSDPPFHTAVPFVSGHADYKIDAHGDMGQAMSVVYDIIKQQPVYPTFRFDVPMDEEREVDLVVRHRPPGSVNATREEMRVRFTNVSWRPVYRYSEEVARR
jgi:hypothetical protein